MKNSDRTPDWHELLDQYSPPLDTDSDKDRDENTAPQASTKVERRRHPIQDRIDLHGLNSALASQALVDFVRESRRRRLKKILVVHGKGLHSSGRESGILRSLVQEWLRSQKEIRHWESAPATEGGQGATWIWLGN